MPQIIKISRPELFAEMRNRDGDNCMHPECGRDLDFSLVGTDTRMEPTIDHWMPQYWCREQGWSYEEVWDITNLRLMHKGCNAKKGGLIPNDDGTLPPRPTKMWQRRAEKRSDRPDICQDCNSGRMLDLDEICSTCGSGPMPQLFPALYSVSPKDCPHEGPWNCWACVLGIETRTPAIVDVLDGSQLED